MEETLVSPALVVQLSSGAMPVNPHASSKASRARSRFPLLQGFQEFDNRLLICVT